MNNTIFINRIFLDNYKLFENFTLEFNKGLNIFDELMDMEKRVCLMQLNF